MKKGLLRIIFCEDGNPGLSFCKDRIPGLSFCKDGNPGLSFLKMETLDYLC